MEAESIHPLVEKGREKLLGVLGGRNCCMHLCGFGKPTGIPPLGFEDRGSWQHMEMPRYIRREVLRTEAGGLIRPQDPCLQMNHQDPSLRPFHQASAEAEAVII